MAERSKTVEHTDIQYLSRDDALVLVGQVSQNFSMAFQLRGPEGEQALGGALGNLYYYDTLLDQAAALYWKLAKNHPFNNGNKRFSLLAMDVFLAINGALADPDVDDPEERNKVIAQLGEKVAAGELDWRDISQMLVQTQCEPMSLQDATEFSLRRRSNALRILSKR